MCELLGVWFKEGNKDCFIKFPKRESSPKAESVKVLVGQKIALVKDLDLGAAKIIDILFGDDNPTELVLRLSITSVARVNSFVDGCNRFWFDGEGSKESLLCLINFSLRFLALEEFEFKILKPLGTFFGNCTGCR